MNKGPKDIRAMKKAGTLASIEKLEAAAQPYQPPTSTSSTKPPATPKSRPLPPIRNGSWIADNPPTLPPEIVRGMLHRGCKMVLGGGSKSFKTWGLIDLAISIATGSPWWGLETATGVVVYLNFEIPEPFFHSRLRTVAEFKGVALPPNLYIWNLRGHAAAAGALFPKLTKQLEALKPAGLVIDPAYKLSLGSDENSGKDVALLMNEFDNLAEDTGAATVIGTHFSKGNQSTKEALDRISGSGVYARDPDSILTMTRHEEEDAFTVEATLRNCPPMAPFVVKWEYPLFAPAEDLDPADLRKRAKTGKEPRSPLDIIDELPWGDGDGWGASKWQKHCEKEPLKIPKRTFYDLLKKAKEAHALKFHQRADETYVRVA
jgi:hypothetical protein